MSEWYNACSAAGTTAYPYGPTYVAGTCNVGGTTLVAAGSLPNCRGTGAPFDELFDMSGNVREWVDSCTGTFGATDSCARRGGGIDAESGFERSSCDETHSSPRNTTSTGIGFRCCADAEAP